MVLYDIIWYYMILYDIIWYYMILYDIIWYYITLYYTIQYNTIEYNTIQTILYVYNWYVYTVETTKGWLQEILFFLSWDDETSSLTVPLSWFPGSANCSAVFEVGELADFLCHACMPQVGGNSAVRGGEIRPVVTITSGVWSHLRLVAWVVSWGLAFLLQRKLLSFLYPLSIIEEYGTEGQIMVPTMPYHLFLWYFWWKKNP